MVQEAAFVSECMVGGKPCAYLQTHTGDDTRRTIRNEWFEIGAEQSGAPKFTPLESAPEGTVTELTVDGSPAWTQEELEALNARNIEYNGKLYTQYEISQMQRARERNVRKWKKRYLSEDAAGLDTTNSAVRLRAARQSLSEFTSTVGTR